MAVKGGGPNASPTPSVPIKFANDESTFYEDANVYQNLFI